MPKDVEEIEMIFISFQKLTVKEAREMEVYAIQELLERINSHEKIRPYLREYPFKTDRVGVAIAFEREDGERPLDGSVAYMFLARNRIFYRAAEMRMTDPIPFTEIKDGKATRIMLPGRLKSELIPIMDEPYEEALKIVQKEQNRG